VVKHSLANRIPGGRARHVSSPTSPKSYSNTADRCLEMVRRPEVATRTLYILIRKDVGKFKWPICLQMSLCIGISQVRGWPPHTGYADTTIQGPDVHSSPAARSRHQDIRPLASGKVLAIQSGSFACERVFALASHWYEEGLRTRESRCHHTRTRHASDFNVIEMSGGRNDHKATTTACGLACRNWR